MHSAREEGDWEAWIAFLVRGVRETANQAAQTARRLVQLFNEDHAQTLRLGRSAGSALPVHDQLQAQPILSIAMLSDHTGLSVPAVTSALAAVTKK